MGNDKMVGVKGGEKGKGGRGVKTVRFYMTLIHTEGLVET